MKNKFHTPRVFPVLFVTAIFGLPLSSILAQGTAFTYQGRLNDGGAPASGAYDIRFAIYNSSANGNAIGNALTNAAIGVTNGIFSTMVDFGAGVFTGSNYWLDIAVRTNGGTSFTGLTPRQPLTPAPYAIMANSASNLLGTVAAGQLNGAIGNNNLPSSASFSGTVAANSFSGDGGSLTNLNASKLATGTVPLAQLPGPVLTNNESGAVTLNNNLTLNGTLNLPATVVMTSGGFKFLVGDQNNNLFMGLAAGLHDTFGFNNTAYGYNAFPNNKTGTDNTAVGYVALANLGSSTPSGGTNNIGIGSGAGYNYTGNESGNIDIGHSGVQGENNTIHIGSPGVQTSAFIAGNINGNGGGLTNLNASQLASGNIADARLSGNVALLNGSQTFTGANTFSSDLTTFGTAAGSILVNNDGGVVPGLMATGGAAPGHLRFRNALEVWPNASASAGGFVDVRNTNGNATITLTGATGALTASNVTANAFAGSGAGLTNLNASQLSSGAIADARLSTNVALLNASQTFTGANTFSNNSTTFGTAAGSVAVINDGGAVPGITAAGGLAPGHMRFRNALEVWPNATASAGGAVDIRNTKGNPTIALTGATGSITASNVTANALVGSGAGLTNLNASQLSSGTVPLTQLPTAVITNNQTSAVTLNGSVTAATLAVTNQLRLNDRPLYFRTSGDANHGLAYSGGIVTNFGSGNVQVDGPVLWGFSGGALAMLNGGAHSVLNWNNAGVSINGTISGDGGGLTNTTTAANYVFAYDTTTQTNNALAYSDISIGTTVYLNGWSRGDNTSFTCHQSGLYSIQYSASTLVAITNSADQAGILLQAVNNGTSIPGSDSYQFLLNGSNLAGSHLEKISHQFLANFNSGDVLKFQFVQTGDFAELFSLNTSFSCTIMRIR